MFGLGTFEIIVIIAILVLLFGPKRIPGIAREISEAIRYVRNSFSSSQKTETDKSEKKDVVE